MSDYAFTWALIILGMAASLALGAALAMLVHDWLVL